MQNVYLGRYERIDGSVVEGPSLRDLVAEASAEVDAARRGRVAETPGAGCRSWSTPRRAAEAYDQMIGEGNDEGNAAGPGRDRRTDRADHGARARRSPPSASTDRVRGLRQPRRSGGRVPVAALQGNSAATVRDQTQRPPCAGPGWRARQHHAVRRARRGRRRRGGHRPGHGLRRPEAYERNPGGATTTRRTGSRSAFSQPAANMGFARPDGLQPRRCRVPPAVGRRPGVDRATDGLGPLYNARACRPLPPQRRPRPPARPAAARGQRRLDADAPQRAAAHGGGGRALAEGRLASLPEPTYGGQLQDLAIPGHAAEGAPGHHL